MKHQIVKPCKAVLVYRINGKMFEAPHANAAEAEALMAHFVPPVALEQSDETNVPAVVGYLDTPKIDYYHIEMRAT